MDKDDVLDLMAEPFGKALLKQVSLAYKIRCGTHDESIGDNAMTFGMNVRFTVEKLLEEAFSAVSGLTISRPVGSFQISYRGHIFHFYKFGMSAADSIDQLSFDDSSTKINLVMDNQLALPGMPRLRHWVIAHSGNPQQGLIEVYVGAPNTHGDRGSPWAWRQQVYALNEQLDFTEAMPDFFARTKPMEVSTLMLAGSSSRRNSSLSAAA